AAPKPRSAPAGLICIGVFTACPACCGISMAALRQRHPSPLCMEPRTLIEESVTQDFWSFCLSRLESELPPQQFSTWIKALKADGSDNPDAPSLRLLAPNRFVLQWVRERYLRRIGELGEEFHGEPIDLQLVLPNVINGATTLATDQHNHAT